MNDILPIKFLGYIHFDEDDSPDSSLNKKVKEGHDMTFIYVISNSIYAQSNIYKIGKHTGTKKMLLKRYKTYLIEPIIYLFFPTGDFSNDETNLLKRFSKYRMGTSEFLQIHIDTLLDKIHLYYRIKYERNPCVKIAHHICISECKSYDIYGKKITGKDCIMRENLIYQDKNEFKRIIQFKIENESIYNLDLYKISEYLESIDKMKDFLTSFMIEFNKRDSVLFLDKFYENGWNNTFIKLMTSYYGYESFKEISRKDFLRKEHFPERIILIKYSDVEPLEWVMHKVQAIQTCFMIEDKNIYSLDNIEVNLNISDLFYYLFYFL